MITVLKTGSRGPLVEDLQRALNANLKPTPNLRPDGKFGARTRRAVRAFQRSKWLVVDGSAGACTHDALYSHETYTPILHNISFISQPTRTTCWAASTAMMKRSSVAAVKLRAPSNMWSEQAGLSNSSESNAAIVTGSCYARIHGLRCNPPKSWMLSALRAALQSGPLMFDMLWSPRDYISGAGSPGHMIVVVGMRGNNDGSGAGTTVRVNDPWPPGKGKRHSVSFSRWMDEVPTRTYRVFER